ncbi:MAG TPA: FecR family protein [Fimbriimonas sp.]|nr:FecR family protein [Fimbriimonas sp.]
MRQGAQIYAPESSRAEVQFDDGSAMRLGSGAVATLTTLYSDSTGEFTEIKLNNGLATLHLVNKNSLYQIDTPTASIKAYGPAQIRVGDTSGLEVAVQSGEALCEGAPGKLTLRNGEYLDLPKPNSPCVVKHVPPADHWDQFNSNRNNVVYHRPKYVPSNIGLVAGGLDNYGTWHNDTKYGHVWVPRERHGWRPYHDGSWVWEDPFGWTWVGDEDWGWAPYHYGTWVDEPYGWAWCPGPARQCWSPAVVDFDYYDDDVAWVPLAPDDVHYASIGFGSGDFYLSFSIGRTGLYYADDPYYVVPRPWDNVYVNTVTYYDVNRIGRYYGDPGFRAAWVGGRRFIPRNTRYGSTFVAAASFGRGRGSFGILASNRAMAFARRGRSFSMPRGRAGQVSGPFGARPVAASFTPTRAFNGRAPSRSILARQVFRSRVPRFAARRSTDPGRTITPSGREARVVRAGGAAQGMRVNPRGSNFAARPGMTRPGAGRQSAMRPGRPGTTANRFNRFNNLSHSRFTRPNPANARNAAAMRRAAAAHNVASMRGKGRPSFATNRANAKSANAHGAAARAAARHAAAMRGHGRSSFAANRASARSAAAAHRAAAMRGRSRSAMRSNRASAHRPSMRANRASANMRRGGSNRRSSFTRPRMSSRRSSSFGRPRTSHASRPSYSRPSRPSRSFSRPSFSRLSRPSRPSRSFSRPSRSRSSGGGHRSGGGGRRRGH